MPAKVWKVGELIRQLTTDLYRYNDVAVEGEVTNCTNSAAGHCYFHIKDKTSSIKVVMFATSLRFLRFRIENGLQLIVRGRLTIWEAKGELQLSAVAAEPAGLGALQLAFEQLKKQLAGEGLFDSRRKRPIPMLPQKIAVITSPTGAALRDVLNVLGRRFSGLHLQIYPVRVQGTGAAREIATALDHLSRWQAHDVILLCRGGGSLEDLWPFNEEIVARALAGCTLPVISGVGHETDFTIADMVADLRAATPSAAAEIVIRAKSDLCTQIDQMARRVRHVIETRMRGYRYELRHLVSGDRLLAFPRRMIRRRERLDRLRDRMHRRLEARARLLRVATTFEPRIASAIATRVAAEKHNLARTAATLQAVSPLSVLSRGYAIAFSRSRNRRRPILDSATVQVGDPIEVQLRRGALSCTVDSRTLGIESVWPAMDTDK